MHRTNWISQLGTLYRESAEAAREEQETAIGPLVRHFNKTLNRLKREYPNNETITSIKEINATKVTQKFIGSAYGGIEAELPPSILPRLEAAHEIKLNCSIMANALGYDLPDLENGRIGDNVAMFTVETNQIAQQSMNQSVTVDTVMEMVNNIDCSPNDREELKSVVETFVEELSKEEPDPSKLEQLLERGKSISTNVAAGMLGVAAQEGGAELFKVLAESGVI